jgi:hypothetical protein
MMTVPKQTNSTWIGGAKALYARIDRFFTGPDIFISYPRSGVGNQYATALANHLSEKYECLFDKWRGTPGKKAPPRFVQDEYLKIVQKPDRAAVRFCAERIESYQRALQPRGVSVPWELRAPERRNQIE